MLKFSCDAEIFSSLLLRMGFTDFPQLCRVVVSFLDQIFLYWSTLFYLMKS